MENHPKPLFLRSLRHAACPPDRYLGLLVAGRDAAAFLQGQLTQDVGRSDAGELRLAALLTSQGRVLAVPSLARHEESIVLLLPAALAPVVRDALTRYVLRTKVTLSLAALAAPLAARFTAAIATRRERTTAESTPAGASAGTSADGAAAATSAADVERRWMHALVEAGLPEIGVATSGEWIPQMLNLDMLGAISFTKGCYTGQEIVARTQNLGRIKRRMFRYETPTVAPPPPKTALSAGGHKVGEVVLAVATAGGSELLAVVNLDARDAPLALADGAPCRPVPLPYAVPA